MAMDFDHQGFTFLSHSGLNESPLQVGKELANLAATGANAVSIVARDFETNATSNVFVTTANTTDFGKLGTTIDQAHALGLSVTLTPWLDPLDGTDRAKLAPTDIDAWFHNYTDLIVDYAKVAQAHGVEMLSLGTEMTSVINASTAGNWEDLIAAVRSVYSGQLTYQSQAFHAAEVPFWQDLDVISVNGYVPVATDNTPTVDSVVKAWNTIPTDPTLAAGFDYKSPVDFFRDLALTYGKPFQFGEIGYRDGDGAGMHPGSSGTAMTLDPEEQKTLYQGFFQVFSQETSWFGGANLFDWTTTHDTGTVYNMEYSPALDLIESWYRGENNSTTGSARVGTAAGETLTGGTGNDVLQGGAGNDILLGGRGDDQLSGDGGTSAPSGKLVVLATGTPAAGVDALMQVAVNGQVLGVVSVPKHADGSSSSFTFDLPTGTTISSVAVSFLNDAVTATEDRNLYVQQVTINGVALDAATATNSWRQGTLSLKSKGTISFDLSHHPELSSAALPGNDTLDGGQGADHMAGGAGNDIYYVDNVGDVVVEAKNEGNDTVHSTIGYALPDNVEALILDGGASVNATGNALDNLIVGNAGNNLLNGMAGIDTVSYANATGAVDANLWTGKETGFGNDTLAGFENLVGSSFDDRLAGNAGNNVIDGGAGADKMYGGSGNDSFYVDNAGDRVFEDASHGFDQVFASVSFTLTTSVEQLTLTGTANIDGTGNSSSNILIGNSGSNVLDGGAGADTLTGGTGNDRFVFDTFSRKSADADTITDFAHGTDSIAISRTVFAAFAHDGAGALNPLELHIGTAATTAAQHLIYDQAKGALYYDDDGSGAHAQVLIALLHGATLDAGDIVLI